MMIFLISVFKGDWVVETDFFFKVSRVISAYEIKNFFYWFWFFSLIIDFSILRNLIFIELDYLNGEWFTHFNASFNASFIAFSACEQIYRIDRIRARIFFHRTVSSTSSYKSSHLCVIYLIILTLANFILLSI